jgi:uncharacterized protein YhbP (UPF0306 family)
MNNRDKIAVVKKYLESDAPTLQLATVHGGKPWIATVYFVVDDELRVYWLSTPERRHSRELMDDSRVAAAVVIKPTQPVIGVQLEGSAAVVTDADIVRQTMTRYIEKYDQGKQFYDNFTAGTNDHQLYVLIPERVVLFDEQHYPAQSPLQILL